MWFFSSFQAYVVHIKKKKSIKQTKKHHSLHNSLLLYQAKILKDLIYAIAWGTTDLLPTEVNEFNKTSKGSFLGYLLPLQAKNEKVKKNTSCLMAPDYWDTLWALCHNEQRRVVDFLRAFWKTKQKTKRSDLRAWSSWTWQYTKHLFTFGNF